MFHSICSPASRQVTHHSLAILFLHTRPKTTDIPFRIVPAPTIEYARPGSSAHFVHLLQHVHPLHHMGRTHLYRPLL